MSVKHVLLECCLMLAHKLHLQDISLLRKLDGTILSKITYLPLPEQACIQLVTGLLPCQNYGKAFSSPLCKLGYRFLPWNPEMEKFLGGPTRPPYGPNLSNTYPSHIHDLSTAHPVPIYSLQLSDTYLLIYHNP